MQHIELATRFGSVRVDGERVTSTHRATRALSYEAGLEVREPESPVYGSLNFLIEGYDTERRRGPGDQGRPRAARASAARAYGLVRHDGFLMHFPGKNFMLANVTHFETPLDPLDTGRMVFEGRGQADNVIRFLRAEFPADLRERADPRPTATPASGRRAGSSAAGSSRWTISARARARRTPPLAAPGGSSCTTRRIGPLGEVRSRTTSTTSRSAAWSRPDADNIVAAGRCVDGDVVALSAIRVMGPCIAMGAAAAHALDLAGSGPVHAIDLNAFQQRLHDNLDRRD